MPIRKPKPTSPGPPLRHLPGLRRDHEDRAREDARRGPQEVRRAQRQRPQDRPATAAAAPSACTARSTSSAARTAIPAKVAAIEYDPNRTAYIALLHYADGEKRYILAPAAPAGRRDGRCRARAPRSRSATACRWRNMPAGTVVHNVELQPGPRRPDRPLRRRRHPADGEGGRAWRRCACPPARCAWCAPSAARPSARSATPTTRTSRSARPAASATWACARRRAARR